MWAWGSNDSGQLADGTATERWTPVQVAGLGLVGTGAEGLAGADEHPHRIAL